MPITIEHKAETVEYRTLKDAARAIVSRWYAHNLSSWEGNKSNYMIAAIIAELWLREYPLQNDDKTVISDNDIFVAVYVLVASMRTADTLRKHNID